MSSGSWLVVTFPKAFEDAECMGDCRGRQGCETRAKPPGTPVARCCWTQRLAAAGTQRLAAAGTQRLAAAGTAGVPPAMSAKREQWLLTVGSFAGGTPAVRANGDHFFLLSL